MGNGSSSAAAVASSNPLRAVVGAAAALGGAATGEIVSVGQELSREFGVEPPSLPSLPRLPSLPSLPSFRDLGLLQGCMGGPLPQAEDDIMVTKEWSAESIGLRASRSSHDFDSGGSPGVGDTGGAAVAEGAAAGGGGGSPESRVGASLAGRHWRPSSMIELDAYEAFDPDAFRCPLGVLAEGGESECQDEDSDVMSPTRSPRDGMLQGRWQAGVRHPFPGVSSPTAENDPGLFLSAELEGESRWMSLSFPGSPSSFVCASAAAQEAEPADAGTPSEEFELHACYIKLPSILSLEQELAQHPSASSSLVQSAAGAPGASIEGEAASVSTASGSSTADSDSESGSSGKSDDRESSRGRARDAPISTKGAAPEEEELAKVKADILARVRAEVARLDAQERSSAREHEHQPDSQPPFLNSRSPVDWTPSSGSLQAALPDSIAERKQRELWGACSVLEVFSASLDGWHVGRVLRVDGGVLVVQFLGAGGAVLQKSVPRCHEQLACLGRHTSEVPPNFRTVPSVSRPGHLTYEDLTTGLKYKLVDHAWTVHFWRALEPSATAAAAAAAAAAASFWNGTASAPTLPSLAPPAASAGGGVGGV